jgi:hypothetical protein
MPTRRYCASSRSLLGPFERRSILGLRASRTSNTQHVFSYSPLPATGEVEVEEDNPLTLVIQSLRPHSTLPFEEMLRARMGLCSPRPS